MVTFCTWGKIVVENGNLEVFVFPQMVLGFFQVSVVWYLQSYKYDIALTSQLRSALHSLSLYLCVYVTRADLWNEQRNGTVKSHARTALVPARNLRRIVKGRNTGSTGSDVRDQPRRVSSKNGCRERFKTRACNRIEKTETGVSLKDKVPMSIVWGFRIKSMTLEHSILKIWEQKFHIRFGGIIRKKSLHCTYTTRKY